MKETEKNLPLEKRFFDVEINGTTKRINGINETWLIIKERNFNKYMSHPLPVNGSFIFGERELWLELTNYIIDDLEWLLQQKHHIFWSFMIFSKSAHQLLISFLQEAPPYYMRNEFPKDEEMEKSLDKIEHLILLIFIRLSTVKESESRYIDNLGKLLYDNYIFTIPILLDICLIYGIKYRNVIGKMIRDVISAAPDYLNDLQEIFPHLLHILSIVRDKFDNNSLSMYNKAMIGQFNEIRDLILHLYDSTSTIQLFLDIYSNDNNIESIESFESEIASFYSNIIPKIYKFIKSNDCNMFRLWKLIDKMNDIRIDLIEIVRSRFCQIINEILNSNDKKDEFANKYLTKMMEILHEPIFLLDYHRLYNIDGDMKILIDLCPNMDSENFSYISKAISPLIENEEMKNNNNNNNNDDESMKLNIKQVKDIFPDLENDFIINCLNYFDYNSERVISAILENNIPSDLYNNNNNNNNNNRKRESDSIKLNKIDKIKSKNSEMFNLLNDKSELREMRERFSQLSFISTDDYDDEYDDTYDSRDVLVKIGDDPDLERRPFVTPRILRMRESDDEEEEVVVEEEEKKKERPVDEFVPNPAELRARQEQKRMERRDCVGRGRGRGQDRQVLANREFKNTHKSFMANHNRRKLASRKRNVPFVNS